MPKSAILFGQIAIQSLRRSIAKRLASKVLRLAVEPLPISISEQGAHG